MVRAIEEMLNEEMGVVACERIADVDHDERGPHLNRGSRRAVRARRKVQTEVEERR